MNFSKSLVADYSSSGSEDELEIHEKTKEQNSESVENKNKACDVEFGVKNLPLPDSLLGLFNDDREEHTNCPSRHEGRTRSFPHEKNNWATYVYIDCTDCDLEEVQELLVNKYKLEMVESPHISLSKVVSLKHHWIQPLMEGLSRKLLQLPQTFLVLDDLGVFVNEENTRTFIGLSTCSNVAALKELSGAVDECLDEFGLPSFYDPPSYHVSLGWCLGDQKERLINQMPKMRKDVVELLNDDPDIGRKRVEEVCCKSGNRLSKFKLIRK